MKIEVCGKISKEDIRNAILMANVGHSESLETPRESNTVEDIISGKALWQCAEILKMTLKVSGITRTLTHQLVRARIGVTFSQHCSGEGDWRHRDILLPRCFPVQDADLISKFLNDKQLYAKLVDSGLCVQEARMVLPQNLDTFIVINACVGTLAQIYSKRLCTMTQSWEAHIFAKKLKEAVVNVHPWLSSLFVDQCSQGRCWYFAGRATGGSGTGLFHPDFTHDKFDWHPNSYVHGGTHASISSGPKIDPRYFIDGVATTKRAYLQKAKEYGWSVDSCR
jgi:thymidylate synthase (FAD)